MFFWFSGVREPRPWCSAILYPIRDLLGFLLWNASYVGNEVLWRGEVYELPRGGLMRKRSLSAARVRWGERGVPVPFLWRSRDPGDLPVD